MKNFLLICSRKCAPLFVGTGISNSKFAYELLKIIKRMIKPKIIEIENCKILLDKNDTYGFTFSSNFDTKEIELIKKIIKKGDVVVDVGANIGIYTCILAKLACSNGHVYSFEPIPENARLIRESIKLNNFKNVTVIPKGVSAKSSKLTMYLAKDVAGHSFAEFEGCVGKKIIDVTTIDDEIQEEIKFIKIDAEGYDFQVLKGMEKTIKNSHDLNILIEFYPSQLRSAGDSPKTFLEYLLQNNFKCIDLTTNEYLNYQNIDKIIQKYTHRPNHLTNFLCSKQ